MGRPRVVGDLRTAQEVPGHDRHLVAVRRQAERLGMHDLTDTAELREAVVRHDRDPHTSFEKPDWCMKCPLPVVVFDGGVTFVGLEDDDDFHCGEAGFVGEWFVGFEFSALALVD